MSSNTNNLREIMDWVAEMHTTKPKGWNDAMVTEKAVAAVLALLPENKEPKNLHLTTDNGGFLGNYCDTCKIYTFDRDTFEETGAWCLCYPFNSAIDQTRRNLIGEQLGSSQSAVDAPAQGHEADNRGESAHPKGAIFKDTFYPPGVNPPKEGEYLI
jgi:hypothetical protein